MQGLDLSPLGLFLAAGVVGKAVMAVLFIASLWCWVLIVEGVVSVVRLRGAVGAARWEGAIAGPLAGVVAAGETEAHRRIPGETVSEVRARIADGMARAARELLTRAEGGLPNLAVISSVAPFIGLFGTVWGIMSSFAAISQANDTSSCHRCARHRRVACGDRLRARRGDPGVDRLQPHRRRLRPPRPADGLVCRGAGDPAHLPPGRGRARRGLTPPQRGAVMALNPRKVGEGLYQPLAEINVTPLVDVMLVLLIIFMVTAPMLAVGIKVNLPGATTAQPLESKDP